MTGLPNHRMQATACALANCSNYTRRAGARRAWCGAL